MKIRSKAPPSGTGIAVKHLDECKRPADAWRESAERFRSLADNSPDIIDRFDRRFRHLYLNPAGALLHGVPTEQIIGKTIRETGLAEPFSSLWERRIRKVFRSARPIDVSDSFPTRNGLRHFESRCIPEFDSQRRGQSVLVVSRDITERKQTEDALRQSEADLAEAQRVAKIGSWRFDIVSDRVRWSRELYRIFGVKERRDGGPYRFFFRCVHPDDRQLVLRTNDEARKQGKPFDIEYRIVTPSGAVKTIREIGHAMKDAAGKVTGLLGTAQDITESKQAEERLRDSEARYRGLFEQAADSIVVFDPKTAKILEFNDAACQRLGYTREEFAKLRVADLDVVETTAEVVRHSHRVMRQGQLVFETQHRTKGGAILDVEVWPKVVHVGGKTVILGIWRYITERKRIETALRKREADLTALFEGSTEPILTMNMDFLITKANAAMGKAMEVPATELIGKNPLDLLPPALAQSRLRRLRQTMRTGKPQRGEDERNGRMMESIIYPIRGADGGTEGVAVLVHDLTERKRLEEQLKATNQELEAKVKQRTARLRSLAAELTQAEHKERRRIA